jgi:hypothetical protein
MTKVGKPIPQIIVDIRKSITSMLSEQNIAIIDSDSFTTGKDFLIKIWDIMVSVPLGIAIIDKSMSPQTMANVFYEIGWMHALGKEMLVVKTKGTLIPSDFIRTEYVEYDDNFIHRFNNFISSFDERAEYFATIAEQVENNPLLAIDYYRRAYLISGETNYCDRAVEILKDAGLEKRAKSSVEVLLAGFTSNKNNGKALFVNPIKETLKEVSATKE